MSPDTLLRKSVGNVVPSAYFPDTATAEDAPFAEKQYSIPAFKSTVDRAPLGFGKRFAPALSTVTLSRPVMGQMFS